MEFAIAEPPLGCVQMDIPRGQWFQNEQAFYVPVRLAAMNPSGGDVSQACSQASHSCTASNRAASSGSLRGSLFGFLPACSCAVAMQCSHTAGPCTITLARAPAAHHSPNEFEDQCIREHLLCRGLVDCGRSQERYTVMAMVRHMRTGLHPEIAYDLLA